MQELWLSSSYAQPDNKLERDVVTFCAAQSAQTRVEIPVDDFLAEFDAFLEAPADTEERTPRKVGDSELEELAEDFLTWTAYLV